MVLQASPRSSALAQAIRFGLLALGGLLLGHQAVYAAEFGAGSGLARAMTAGGHGYWPVFSTFALSGLILLLGRATWRLARLRAGFGQRELVAARAAAAANGPPARSYSRELLGLWPPLFAVVTVAFVVQENLEHLGHGHVPGIAPLVAPDSFLALPVLAIVTLVLAALGALLHWRIAVLEGQVRSARSRPARRRAGHLRPPVGWTIVGAMRATFWSLARQGPVRAPPGSCFA